MNQITSVTAVRSAPSLGWLARWLSWALAFNGFDADAEAGARWSLQPLIKPPIPLESTHPIDAFVSRRLQEMGTTFSPEADRRTLLRRLSFNLTGLPATPAELEAFLMDVSPGAYERVVERLLSSPRFGEHWGRHWLDLANYADTHGNDHDYARTNAWPYRDYVIGAMNHDKPYARFIQEQVAGDVLFPSDPQATVALGFLAAGPWDETLMVGVREDTVDHAMAQNLDRDSYVTAVMSTFQSLTVHCARCHDHKFDPISQREYYALQAVFAGVDRVDRAYDEDPAITRRRSELATQRDAVQRRQSDQLPELESERVRIGVRDLVDRWHRRERDWTPLAIRSVVSANSPETTRIGRQADNSWLVTGARLDADSWVITAETSLRGIRAVRLEVLPDPSLPQGGAGRFDNGNFHLSEFRIFAQPSKGVTAGFQRLAVSRAIADHSDGKDAVSTTLDGRDDTYWSIHPRYNEAHEAVFELQDPVGFEGGTSLTMYLDFKGKPGHQIGRFRLSIGSDLVPSEQREPLPARLAQALRSNDTESSVESAKQLALLVLEQLLEREWQSIPAPRWVYSVSKDFAPKGSLKPPSAPRPIHVLARGDIQKPRETVSPGTLSCIDGLSSEWNLSDTTNEGQRRAALARWLVADGNVLTWRSIVNRVWHYHFGRGLCDTPSDFGAMGTAPSHPELLDWLAVWFRDNARGSLKALHRLILTSATYRQSSRVRKDAPPLDQDNRWLWRMNSTRLSAEAIRDSVLQFSGKLDLTEGGPPAVQFVHRGAATFMPDGGAPPFLDYASQDPDSRASQRRAVYRFIFRTVPDPLMEAMDCPDGAFQTPVRNSSTTALQALAMLNDPFLLRHCQHMATRFLEGAPGLDEAVKRAFETILLRAPSQPERETFTQYARQHGLANACHLLINSNEFLYLD